MLRHRLHDPRLDDLHLVDRLPPDIAERTAERLRHETAAEVRLGDEADQLLALQEEVQSDGDDLAAIPAPGVLSGSQVRGVVSKAPIGVGSRVGLWVLVGALFGAASGFVFGGGRQPELEGRVRDSSPEITITVHAPDLVTAEAADAVLTDGDHEAAARARHRARQGEQHAFDPLTADGRPSEQDLRDGRTAGDV